MLVSFCDHFRFLVAVCIHWNIIGLVPYATWTIKPSDAFLKFRILEEINERIEAAVGVGQNRGNVEYRIVHAFDCE